MAAAQAIARDPEIGGLVAEAPTLNALAPKTAAALRSPRGTSTEPKAEPVEAAVAKPPAAGEPRSGPNVGLLVAAILLIVFAIVAAVVVLQVLPAIRGAAPACPRGPAERASRWVERLPGASLSLAPSLR